MTKLIALVAIAVAHVVDGETRRTVVQPGEEVLGLGPVDIAELKACGALQDADEEQAQARQAQKAEQAAAREFASARKAVQAAQAELEAKPALAP